MIDIQRIRQALGGHPLVRNVDQVPRGHVRLETAFLYPDGSSVDIFVPDEEPLLPPSKVSDLGQTTSWLADVQLKPWLSRKRQRFVEDALRIYSVSQSGGALETTIADLDAGLMDGIVRLGQACVRVADLTYTRRTSLQAGIEEEVEEVLADCSLTYQPGADLPGRFGKVVRVNFLVEGKRTKSALLTISSANASQSHILANEIFRKWYDLDVPTRTEQRVTLFDDRYDAYRAEDLECLRDMSNVVALSDRQSLIDLIAA